MKPPKFLNWLLSSILISSFLGYCPKNHAQESFYPIRITKIDCTETSNSLSQAYRNFNKAQTNFLANLELALKNDKSQSSTNSRNFAECTTQLQNTIKDFENTDLTTFDLQTQRIISDILDDLKTDLDNIETIIINPLQEGLLPDNIERIHDNLRLNISSSYKSNFSSSTLREIQAFLLRKQQTIQRDIHTVELQILSHRKPNNLTLWLILLATSLISCASLFLAIISFLKIRQMMKQGKELKNRLDKSKLVMQNEESISAINSPISKYYQQILNEINQGFSTISQQLNQLNTQINPQSRQSNLISNPNPLNHETELTPSFFDENYPASNFSISQLVEMYNRDPNLLSFKMIEVSPTDESLSNRRLGNSQTVILEKKRRGNYCIIQEGNNHYLLPSQNLRINEHNYRTVETFFECRNYNPNASEDFRLVEPAIVAVITNGQTWQLQQAGILEF